MRVCHKFAGQRSHKGNFPETEGASDPPCKGPLCADAAVHLRLLHFRKMNLAGGSRAHLLASIAVHYRGLSAVPPAEELFNKATPPDG